MTGDAAITACFSKGEAGALTLTYPNGGEVVKRGETVTVSWASEETLASVSIYLLDGEGTTTTIVEGEADDGSYEWTVADDAEIGNFNKIKITGVAATAARATDEISDESDDYFSIVGDSFLIVTSPDGGETVALGATQTIKWESADVEGDVEISLYKSGVLADVLASAVSNTGTYDWAVESTRTPGDDYKIKISSVDDPSIHDQSASSFSVVSTEAITLTMKAYPTTGGDVDPVAGDHSIEAGTPIDIEATPAADHEFVRWRVDDSGNATVTGPTSAKTTVSLTGSAVVTAVFTASSEAEEPFFSVSIKINGAKENGDAVMIKNAAVPDDLSADDIDPEDFEIALIIDDYIAELTQKTGELRRKGDKPFFTYKPNRDAANVRLALCLEEDAADSSVEEESKRTKDQIPKRYWSCKLSKASVGASVNNGDGVDVYLSVDGTMFGANLVMDESTKWSFKNKDGEGSSVLDVSGAPLSEFDVESAGGSHFVFAELDDDKAKDGFSVNKGTINDVDFDPTTDAVVFSLDDWSLALSDEDGWKWSEDKRKGSYKAKPDDGSTVTLQLDFAKKQWKFKTSKTDFGDDVNGDDGLDVRLRLGDYEGGVRLDAASQSNLNYPPKQPKK